MQIAGRLWHARCLVKPCNAVHAWLALTANHITPLFFHNTNKIIYIFYLFPSGRCCSNYLHRVPTAEDEARHRAEPQYDIFGRERLAETGRTKGVGSYSRDCTTLYAFIGAAAQLPPEKLHQLLRDEFAEWGPIDDVHAVSSKAIAFVRYRWRASAEFAKAAMHQQVLMGGDVAAVLDVRWANDDPNPKARAAVQRNREEALVGAYVSAVNNSDPETKRARLAQLALSANYTPGAAASAYPDTSGQYTSAQRYSHEYQGWDARAHAEVQQPALAYSAGGGYGPGGVASGSGAVREEQAGQQGGAEDAGRHWGAVQAAAVEEHQTASHVPGYTHWPSAPDEGDDISRYLRPEDVLAGPGTAGTAGKETQAGEGGDLTADALGLIGGYGSDADSGE